jgi:hypothetical protein
MQSLYQITLRGGPLDLARLVLCTLPCLLNFAFSKYIFKFALLLYCFFLVYCEVMYD